MARRQITTQKLSSLGAALKLLLENNSSGLLSLSSSRVLQQQLLDVAHTTLLSRRLHDARVVG
jgi:hypothetical protein